MIPLGSYGNVKDAGFYTHMTPFEYGRTQKFLKNHIT